MTVHRKISAKTSAYGNSTGAQVWTQVWTHSTVIMTYLSILKTIKPYHLLAYSVVLGATSYQSFYSGIVAFKTLDYTNFSKLQAGTFPNYFRMQLALSVLLCATPIFALDRVATVSLGIATAGSLLNVFVLGPRNAKLSADRVAQIAAEGKSHKDPTASDTMKEINKKFAKVHGQSVGTNMLVFLSFVNYGLWLASKIK